jgi:hypothetical protein
VLRPSILDPSGHAWFIHRARFDASNLVLRIITPGRKFILKQSRAQLRTREAWFSDLDRVFREQEVMQFLRSLLPEAGIKHFTFNPLMHGAGRIGFSEHDTGPQSLRTDKDARDRCQPAHSGCLRRVMVELKRLDDPDSRRLPWGQAQSCWVGSCHS